MTEAKPTQAEQADKADKIPPVPRYDVSHLALANGASFDSNPDSDTITIELEAGYGGQGSWSLKFRATPGFIMSVAQLSMIEIGRLNEQVRIKNALNSKSPK